jgi:Zn-dependent metalloprotease
MNKSPFCSIIPPHMLKEIARNGTPHQQSCAWHTLTLSEQLRGQRLALMSLASLAATATGHKRRTIYDAKKEWRLPGVLVRGEGDPILGKDPQPAHMKDYAKTDEDNGGVHINSGIPNKAFYEVAIRLGGYAWEKAGRIWYMALVNRLSPEAGFHEAAKATFAAAGELFGSGTEEQKAVLEGWEAVGIKINSGRSRRRRRKS